MENFIQNSNGKPGGPVRSLEEMNVVWRAKS